MCELRAWRERKTSVDCTVLQTDLSSGSNGAGADASILRQLLAQFIVLFLQRSCFGLTVGVREGGERERNKDKQRDRQREIETKRDRDRGRERERKRKR